MLWRRKAPQKGPGTPPFRWGGSRTSRPATIRLFPEASRKAEAARMHLRTLSSSHAVVTSSPCEAMCPGVLGSARTGLTFTGLQEGAQPGGLTPPGQTELGIPYPVVSRWVPVGAAGAHSLLGSVRRRCCSGDRVCFCRVFSLSVSLLFLFPSVCCSVKLPLSRPTSFCLLLFILLHTPAGGGAAAWRFCCQRQPKPRH